MAILGEWKMEPEFLKYEISVGGSPEILLWVEGHEAVTSLILKQAFWEQEGFVMYNFVFV